MLSPPRIGPVPGALRAAADRAREDRGRLRQFRRLFDRSLVPMLLVDNDRRYTDANVAARLVFRLSLDEMRSRRIDDLTPQRNWPAMELAWRTAMSTGSVSGTYDVEFPDGSGLPVYYAVLKNLLPGRHLIVFVPSDWPGDELPTLDEPLAENPAAGLSPRQREVMRLVAVGADTSQIADELGLSEETVRTHVRDALRRLGARNRAHAVALTLASGLLRSVD